MKPNNYGIQSALSLDEKRSVINSEYYNCRVFTKTAFPRCLIPNTMLCVCSFKQIFNNLGILLKADTLVSKKDTARNLK